ncbi:MAG: deoxyguanosine kinase [Candidatus Hepatoplasma vulgare]|nr:MAG: deoxyguanosine kinase [Candidatus Hepatoplasma sp.]
MRIVISGTVGVGKSTVSSQLVKEFIKQKYEVNFLNEETVDSIYLDFYYKKPYDWAFLAQLDFLFGRFKQWLIDEKKRSNLTIEKNKKYITVYDRHFLDDYVFAELHTIKQNISNFNSITYQAIYKELSDKMNKLKAKPDFFFLLKANLDVIVERLKGRGRSEELDVSLEYWKDLYKNYYIRPTFKNHFQQNVINFVEINTNNKTSEEVVKEILNYISNNYDYSFNEAIEKKQLENNNINTFKNTILN